MQNSALKAKFEPLRELAFGGVGAFYAPVGGPSLNPIRILRINNTLNQNIKVSFDDIDDYDYIPAGQQVQYDFGANKSTVGGVLEMPKITQVYVRYVGAMAPTSGQVDVTMIYASEK